MKIKTIAVVLLRVGVKVAANHRLVKRVMASESKFGTTKILPKMGPFPLDDSFGMAAAVAVLDKSMDPGKYEDHVQWATFRKIRSAINNAWQAGVGGLGDVVGAYEMNRTWISSSPTHHFFFTRFMGGIHRRVREMVRQDKAITIQMMKELNAMFHEEWDELTIRRKFTAIPTASSAKADLR